MVENEGHSLRQYCPDEWILHLDRGEVTVRFRVEDTGNDCQEGTNVRNVIRAILTESYRARITAVGETTDGADLSGTKDIA